MNTNLPEIVALSALLLTGCASAKPDAYRVYFGTSAKGEERGIYMAKLDMKTGALSEAVRVAKATRPGFIAIHPNGKTMYATGEGIDAETQRDGAVSAFQILKDGMLADLNTQPSGGAGTCHVSLDPEAKNLLVANYMGGSCSALPIQSDGSLATPASTQVHSGSSVHLKRQQKPFAHSINTSPDGRFAFVADLGIDKIMIYRFDPETGTLTPNDPPFAAIGPGGGPRHFTFHPNGKFAYTNHELNGKVTAFAYNQESGALTPIQTISTLPEDFAEDNKTAEIITSPDGQFLYVSNRGHDSIAIFGIDADTGKLTFVHREPVRGEVPRNFNIDPTGTYLLAANQKTSNVVVFKIDRKTGRLEYTGSEIKVPNPICVRFLPL
ncbi:lactonase family protein [Pontiella sulfatireligans]|uniref:6-phosphogluconolactonase n=1 Tax=Pontiella sulfatireligans TaxID=2750658 RepID=A0A6C2UKJ8_9BACT|nr:lactonase family protein [Pontiella sulfatireligans]VGO19834.1 6-phosphogluconolactonase [Pontiella sulfatireligans]